MIPDGHDWIDVATLIVALIVAIGGLGGLAGWIITRRKTVSEARKTDADTAMIYQQIADTAAVKALKLEERIAELETKLATKDARIDELEKANDEKDHRIASLQCEVDELRAKVATLEARKK